MLRQIMWEACRLQWRDSRGRFASRRLYDSQPLWRILAHAVAPRCFRAQVNLSVLEAGR